MSLFFGRDGKLSIVRVGTLIAIIGVLLIGGGFLAFNLDQNTYREPLDVEPYPGAESWGNDPGGATSRTLYYLVPGVAPEDVVAYYQQKLTDFSGSRDEVCIRNPFEGSFPDADQPGKVPYQFTCLFQRVGQSASQTTLVTIQPGVASDDPERNTLGRAVIVYEQRWQR